MSKNKRPRKKSTLKRLIGAGLVLLLLVIFLIRGAVIIQSRGETLDPAQLTAEHTESMPLPSGTFIEPESKINVFSTVAETDRFVLHAKVFNGEIALTDKRTGETWYSTPQDHLDDPYAVGGYKLLQMSQLLIDYRTDLGVSMTAGSLLAVNNQDGLSYEEDPEGITFLYDFIKEEISVPVRYTLTDYGLQATVKITQVDEYGPNQLVSVRLLPTFGAGGMEDEGFMLVPDGSGGIIPFQNEQLQAMAYSSPVYGTDAATGQQLAASGTGAGGMTYNEPIRLPVFGLSRNDNAWLGVISEGAARSTIHADIAGRYMAHNYIGASYNVLRMGLVQLTQQGFDDSVNSFPEQKQGSTDFTVEYIFLDSGANSYVDMAEAYRGLLVDQYNLTPVEGSDLPIYLDVYGYVPKQKAFAGVPYRAKVALTELEDVEDMSEAMSAAGIERQVFRLKNWERSGVYDKTPLPARHLNKLGSLDDWNALDQKLAQGGGGIWRDADLQNISESSSNFSKFSDTVLNAAGVPLIQRKVALDSNQADPLFGEWYLLRPQRFIEHYYAYLRNLDQERASLTGLGETLYSDLSNSGISRDQVPHIINSVLANAKATGVNVLLDGANSYTLAYADHVMNTPQRSTEFDLVSESVPFYQFVLHGYFDYSLSPYNLSSDPELMKLQILESGAAPSFEWVGRNVEELQNTRLAGIFSADYHIWLDEAIDLYNEVNSILGPLRQAPITAHEVLATGIRTTILGDTQIVLNYTTRDYEYEGQTVPARDYLIIEGGQS